MVSLMRSFGPFLSGNVFAWSASSGNPWPLNHHFTYLLVFVLCLIGALEAYLLPRSLNKPKEEQFHLLCESGGRGGGEGGGGGNDRDDSQLDGNTVELERLDQSEESELRLIEKEEVRKQQAEKERRKQQKKERRKSEEEEEKQEGFKWEHKIDIDDLATSSSSSSSSNSSMS